MLLFLLIFLLRCVSSLSFAVSVLRLVLIFIWCQIYTDDLLNIFWSLNPLFTFLARLSLNSANSFAFWFTFVGSRIIFWQTLVGVWLLVRLRISMFFEWSYHLVWLVSTLLVSSRANNDLRNMTSISSRFIVSVLWRNRSVQAFPCD